jgi:hypothetical protein
MGRFQGPVDKKMMTHSLRLGKSFLR